MGKVTNFINLLNAINLLLDSGVSIGNNRESGKYAFVNNNVFDDNFSELTWDVVTEHSERFGQDITFAYVSVGGVRFGTYVSEAFLEKHKDREELKGVEAVA